MSSSNQVTEANCPALAVLTSVHGTRDGDRLILDRKALEGLEYRAAHWPGPVFWMLSFRETPPSYSASFDPASLPFRVIEIALDRSDVQAQLPRDAIVEASGNSFQDFGLARAMPGRVVYITEYTLKTRLDILRMSDMPLHRKVRRLIWELLTERKRERAMRDAAGLECNGLPTYRLYGPKAKSALCFFDTRLTAAMQIDDTALAVKQGRIRKGAPLRLAFSGRLDRMKGAQFLLPLMRRLKAKGVPFIFEIFGAGAVSEELEAAAANELAGNLVLNGPVPFAEELVPAMKERIDLFICPHPQGDPSCTYMETLGCGVPIVGFANEAWAAMADRQKFGIAVPLGSIDALADVIASLDRDREKLALLAGEAARFSSSRTFEDVFAARVDYLLGVAGTS